MKKQDLLQSCSRSSSLISFVYQQQIEATPQQESDLGYYDKEKIKEERLAIDASLVELWLLSPSSSLKDRTLVKSKSDCQAVDSIVIPIICTVCKETYCVYNIQKTILIYLQVKMQILNYGPIAFSIQRFRQDNISL